MIKTVPPGRGRPPRQRPGTDETVLLSKITPPGLPGWAVRRPRIDRLIAEGAQRPLTVVTGPPGSGKTMALALWAATYPGAFAWVTLDDYDSRPRVFWSQVIAALRRAGVAVPAALPVPPPRGLAAGHAFLVRLASALAVQDPPVTLILDDLHLLTEPKVLAGLDYVLRNAGSGLHLVAASRMDPLLPLHRYRLAGQLTEIRARDLFFSALEARLLLAQHGITLSAESLDRLLRRAEGWAAGLRLAAISMAGHPDPDQFIKEFAAGDSAVTGYLVDEVLNAQPGNIRDFLLSTSILSRVSPDLAEDLTEDESAPDVLHALAQANAFVQPAGSGWYRYHSLFAAVLRLKLRRENPGRALDLHRRASRWYRRNGSLAEAVRHAAEAGDGPLAARTVVDELAVGQLMEPRADERLAVEFQRMPRDPRPACPESLLVDAAIELCRGQDHPDDASLATAESMLRNMPAGAGIPSRLAAAVIRLALARRTGNLDSAVAAAARAAALLGALPADLLGGHPEMRAQVLSWRGAVELWSGDLGAAAITLDAGAAAAGACDAALERADCLGHLALLRALGGRLNDAAALAADAAIPPGNADGGPPEPVSPAAEVAVACVHLERNQLSLARASLKRADEALHARPDSAVAAVACLITARRSLAEGRAEAAAQILARARGGWSPPGWLDRRMRLLESRARAAAADSQSALDLAASVGPATSADAAIVLAHAWLAAGDPGAAQHALCGVPAGHAAPGWVRLDGWLTDARISYGAGDRGRGRRLLEQALRLGEAEQLRLPFALERAWIRPVLRRDPDLALAFRRLMEPDLVSRPGSVRQAGAGRAAPLIVERLSEREREVLGHAAGMLSTAEIAAEMYISVNTVKTHLKSIYRKLAATQRGEAVRRARQLGLI